MSPTRAARLFARLLRGLPAAYSDADAANMIEIFSLRAERARATGLLSYVACLLREFAGALRVLAADRLLWTRLAGAPGRLWTDVRHATRRLRAAPGFAAASVLTLMIAIGANTAVFTVLHRVVLSPLPYPAADRLVAIDHDAPGIGLQSIGLSLGLYWEYAALPSVEAIALYYTGQQTLTGAGESEQLPFLHTTPSIGGILGVRPALGRWFTDAEGVTGAAPVVFLSHDLWVRRFNASPSVVGTSVQLNGVAHEVVGVAAADWVFPDRRIQLAVPLRLRPSMRRVSGFNYEAIARLAPSTSVQEGRRQQDAVIADIARRFEGDPEVASGTLAEGRITSAMTPLASHVVGETAQLLWLLAAAAVIVLLVAMANLANLNLVRAEARQLELATRRALGAGRRAILATVMTEAALIAGVGGGLGIMAATAAVQILVNSPTVIWPRAHEITVGVDAWIFGVGLTALVALVLGALPIVRRQTTIGVLLHGGGRTHTSGRRTGFAHQALIAAQVGLALVLLMAAGLLGRSADRLRQVDPGFVSTSRLVFEIGLPRSTYRTPQLAAAFNDRLLAQLGQLPGVERVALTSNLPLEGRGLTNPIEVFGRPSGGGDQRTASARQVSLGYFDTMEIPLLRGRLFDTRDLTPEPSVAIVDQAFADSWFPGESPLGRQVRHIGEPSWLTIVGVVGSTATESLREREPARVFYTPDTGLHQPPYIVKTSGDPMALLPTVRRLVAEQDAGVAIARPEALSSVVARSNADVTMVGIAFAGAALAALLLGLVGVYGVVAYIVTQRTSEIGIRLALGATRAHVTILVARQTALAMVLGASVGLLVSLAAGRWLRSWLFDISPTDPATYVVAILVLAVGAGCACWWPARRASAIDPVRAMRQS